MLNESFRLYRHNFLKFVLIAVLLLVPYKLLSFLLANSEDIRWSLAGGLQLEMLINLLNQTSSNENNSGWLESAFSLLCNTILGGMLILTASQCYVHQPVSITANFRLVLKRLLMLIGAYILRISMSILAIMPLIGIVSIFSLSDVWMNNTWMINVWIWLNDVWMNMEDTIKSLLLIATLVSSIALLPVLIFVFIRLSFIEQVILLESRSAVQGVVGSWKLTRGSVWRIIGFSLALALFMLFCLLVVGVAITLVVALLDPGERMISLLDFASRSIAEIIITPLIGIAYTLLFYDLVAHTKGFDLEQQDRFTPHTGSVDYGQSLTS